MPFALQRLHTNATHATGLIKCVQNKKVYDKYKLMAKDLFRKCLSLFSKIDSSKISIFGLKKMTLFGQKEEMHLLQSNI